MIIFRGFMNPGNIEITGCNNQDLMTTKKNTVVLEADVDVKRYETLLVSTNIFFNDHNIILDKYANIKFSDTKL